MITRSIIEKPGKDGSTLSRHFPDFIWLLRDVMLQLPAAEDGQKLSPTDYIIQQVFKHDTGTVVSEADKVAVAIMTNFSSIECVMIPSPSVDPEVIQNIASRQQDLNPKIQQRSRSFCPSLV